MVDTVKRRITDVGEKIGGARKDWARERMALSDAEDMTDEERVRHIQKDNIWPKPDFPALIEGGMSLEAAAMVKIIRDRIAKTPPLDARRPHSTTLMYYLEALSAVRDHLEGCKTLDDVKAADQALQRRFGRGPDNPYFRGEGNAKYFSINRGNKHPVTFRTFDDGPAIRKLLAQGFPDDVPAWRRGFLIRTFGAGEEYHVLKGNKVVASGFGDAAAADAWLKRQWEEARAARSAEDRKKVPERPHLDHVARAGLPDHRGGQDVTETEFMETFGFRAVEFGNWLPDEERQLVLNYGYDAFMDLASALALTPGQMSLDGTLAIAFGARGQSGAAAHYEPDRRVVNLTRLSGAGFVAHEWGHALDHWLGTDTDNAMEIPSLTGWHRRHSGCLDILSHRGDDVAQAANDLLREIMTRPATREERMADIAKRVAGFTRSVASCRAEIDKTVAAAAEKGHKPNAARMGKLERNLREETGHLESWIRVSEATLRAPDGSDFGRRTSSFFLEACKISGEGGYWARPAELFARAFESHVYDTLAQEGGRSDYLVAYAHERFYPADSYLGNPYPSGPERLRLNGRWKDLVDTVRDIIPGYSSRLVETVRDAPAAYAGGGIGDNPWSP